MGWLEDLGKSLPIETIYKDVAQPAFKEIGDAARNTIKASRFLLAPIDYLAAQQDRWQNYLKRVNDKVPEKNMIPAHPQIAGPVLEGLRYLEEENIISELFVNLLARAIDKERVSEAHPAFASIISQLSPDEAVIIFHLNKEQRVYKQYSQLHQSTNTFGSRETIENSFPLNELVYPENYPMYMDHLNALNIGGMWQYGNQEPIMENDIQTGVNIISYAQLTEFGKLFSKACVPETLDVYSAV